MTIYEENGDTIALYYQMGWNDDGEPEEGYFHGFINNNRISLGEKGWSYNRPMIHSNGELLLITNGLWTPEREKEVKRQGVRSELSGKESELSDLKDKVAVLELEIESLKDYIREEGIKANG